MVDKDALPDDGSGGLHTDEVGATSKESRVRRIVSFCTERGHFQKKTEMFRQCSEMIGTDGKSRSGSADAGISN
jgi:hypothetical protein